ncbi:ATP-binding protein [Vibrio mediterranei]|uniref:ATP-binding protein n=1 Tax=Vibrio mediterranei TaxID=689 RepID=UPI00148B986E|nr:ATP-binding protein [Vibrio mediterranei]NOH26820.1 DNA biosynthesis protein [Vibrio mediterranei]
MNNSTVTLQRLMKHIPKHLVPKAPEEMKRIKQESALVNLCPQIQRGSVVGVGEKHRDCRFDNYQQHHDGHKQAVNLAKGWVRDVKAGLYRNLVMAGSTGTGKNHLAVAAVKLLSEGRQSSQMVTFNNLMLRIRATYHKAATETEWSIIESLSKVDDLVIDELGVQRQSDSEFLMLNTLIDNRYANQKPTVLLSNLTGDKLAKLLGQRAFERVIEGDICWIEMGWGSYRLEQGRR